MFLRHAGRLAALVVALALWRTPLAAHGDISERIAALTAEIHRQPTADMFVRRAELYRQAGRCDAALADLDRAERLDPALLTPGLVRAHVLLDTREWAAAVETATRVLARDARNTDALIVRARARVELGQRRAAADDFTGAIAAQPLPELYIERARVLIRGMGRAGLEDALNGLDDGLARLGSVVTLELEALDIERRLGRFDAALGRIDRLTAHASRKDSWLARRGAVLEQAGRTGEARTAYVTALDEAARQPDRVRSTRAARALADQLHADLARLDAARDSRRIR